MNEHQLHRSDRIASTIMKSLAVIGLASIMALVAWVVIRGISFIDRPSSELGAAVTTVTSTARDNPSGTLAFALDHYTYVSGEVATIRWIFKDGAIPREGTFSYACSEGVSFDVRVGSTWSQLLCNTPLMVTSNALMIRPHVAVNRFNDVELSVRIGTDIATDVVSLVNTALEAPTTPTTPIDPIFETPTPTTPPQVITTQPTPTSQPPAVTYVPRPRLPSDLAVNIEATGVLVEVMNVDTFLPLNSIPNNRTGAVRFIVSNRGETTSGTWSFVATLPTEDNAAYRYVSRTQQPLLPGAQVEFTLGFDDLPRSSSGTVRISLAPSDLSDNIANNTDSRVVDFIRP